MSTETLPQDITAFGKQELQAMEQMLSSNSGFAAMVPFIYKLMRHWRPDLKASSIAQDKEDVSKLMAKARTIVALRMMRQEILDENEGKSFTNIDKQDPDLDKQITLEQQHVLHSKPAQELTEELNELERKIYSLTEVSDEYDLASENELVLQNRLDEIYELRLEYVQEMLNDKSLLHELDNDFLKNERHVLDYHRSNHLDHDARLRADKIYERMLELQPYSLENKKGQQFYEAQMRRVALVLASKGCEESDTEKESFQERLKKTSESIEKELDLREQLENEVKKVNKLQEDLGKQQEGVKLRLREADRKSKDYTKTKDENGQKHIEDPSKTPGAPVPTAEPNPNAKPGSPQQTAARQANPSQVSVLRDQVMFQYLRVASYLLVPALETRRGQTAESFSARQNKVEDMTARQLKEESFVNRSQIRPMPPGAMSGA
jgi:hypothetical protein